jgi:hypothetical protein
MGAYEKALPLVEEALEMQQRLFPGDEHDPYDISG